MIKSLRTPMFAGAVLALAAATLPAQTPEAGRKQAAEKVFDKMMTLDFIGGEAVGGKTVKGAPYSADAVTETTQVLGDGNRIVTRNTANLYRDSEGRERREQTLDALGPFKSEGPVRMISIWDPVAKTSYSLDDRNKTARKSSAGTFTFATQGMAVGGVAGGITGGVGGGIPGGVAPSSAAIATTMPADVVFHRAVPEGAGGQVMVYENHSVTRITTDAKDGARLRTEDLGDKLVEGVKAKGSRTTYTIPAGEVGNERPIEVVSERWYSDELQTVMMTKRSDPRSGETTYKLANVNRTEPQKSLFEVPSDYTVVDDRVMKMRSFPRVIEKKDENF